MGSVAFIADALPLNPSRSKNTYIYTSYYSHISMTHYCAFQPVWQGKPGHSKASNAGRQPYSPHSSEYSLSFGVRTVDNCLERNDHKSITNFDCKLASSLQPKL